MPGAEHRYKSGAEWMPLLVKKAVLLIEFFRNKKTCHDFDVCDKKGTELSVDSNLIRK
jgi:hypothetical protein